MTTAGRSPLERHARALLILAASAMLLAATILCAVIAGESFGRTPWPAVFFAAGLTASASAILGHSRAMLAPAAGLSCGLIAFAGLLTAVPLTLWAADLAVDLLRRALNALGQDGDAVGDRIESAFGQTAGLAFFLGNLAIVWAYVAGRVTVVAVLAPFARMPGLRRILGALALVPREIWTNRFLSVLTLTVLVAVWVILVGCAAWASARGGRMLFLGDFPEGFTRFVWSAAFILLAELAGAFHPARACYVPKPPRPQLLPDPDPARVRRLYGMLEAAVVDGSVSLAPQERVPNLSTPPAPERRGTGPDGRVDAVLATVADSLGERDTPAAVADARLRLSGPVAAFYTPEARDSATLVFPETVTTTHYRVFATMILAALDDGGVALLICPDGQAQAVQAEIETVLERTRAGLLAETLRLGSPSDDDKLYDVLVASETALEHELLAKTRARQRELDRLALVVGLDMHRTDLPRVGLMLRRLREKVGVDEIRLAFTLTDFSEPQTVVKQIFLTGSAREVAVARIGSHSFEGQYRFAMPDTQASRTALRGMLAAFDDADHLPDRSALDDIHDSAALVAVAAMRVGLDVVFHDPRGRRLADGAGDVRQTWSYATTAAVDRFFGRAKETRTFESFVARRSLPTADVLSRHGRVVVVEEGLNADAALTRPYDFLDPYPTLVIVLLRDAVPTSDAAVLASTGRGGPVRPSTPEPAMGARGIAYILEPHLRSGGVRETGLARLLQGVPDTVKAGYGFAANRAGLTRLLASATRSDAIRFRDTVDPATGEPVFVLDGTPPEVGLTGRVSVSASGLNGETFLVANDVGLRFVTGAYTAVRRPFELIRGVSARTLSLKAAQDAECSYEDRRAARICPIYTVDLGSGFVVEEGPDVQTRRPEYRQGRSSLTLHSRATILSGTVGRATPAWYDETETVPPFAPDATFTGNRRSVVAAETITVARPMRLLHVAWMLDGDIGVSVAGRPALPTVAGERASPDPRIVGEAAFAAVVLMKEAVVACFPGQGHRVAVFSPQAGTRLADEPGDGARYLRDRYALRSVVTGESHLETLVEPERQAPFACETSSRIDLFVVEDSEWSLGILETLTRRGSDPYRYMKRAADQPPAFGADAPPAYLGARYLRAFLDAWMLDAWTKDEDRLPPDAPT